MAFEQFDIYIKTSKHGCDGWLTCYPRHNMKLVVEVYTVVYTYKLVDSGYVLYKMYF